MRRHSLTEPIAVVSTHLDDAVMFCAHLLHANPSATVIGVFAGASDEMHDGYNSRTTGMRFAPDALRVRRSEDPHAMAVRRPTTFGSTSSNTTIREPTREPWSIGDREVGTRFVR